MVSSDTPCIKCGKPGAYWSSFQANLCPEHGREAANNREKRLPWNVENKKIKMGYIFFT